MRRRRPFRLAQGWVPMAMPTAPVTVQPSPANSPYAAPAVPARPRVLWPWPTFILGVAALVTVANFRHLIQPTDADRMQRDLTELRRVLERNPADLEKAYSLGRRVLDKSGQFPQFVGEAHYLIGCVDLRKAEDPGAPDAADAWAAARKHFEQAQQAGVPDADKPKLSHRLGKVLHLTHADRERALAELMQGEDNDNPAEHWQYLAEAHMLVSKPNYRAALEATRNQLTLAPPTTDAKTLTEARLRQSEIQVRLNELAEARKSLERIDANAPTELYLKSRFILARCYAEEGNHKQAAATWEQVKNNPRLTAAERGAASYHLGLCYARSDRKADALEAWRQAQIHGGEAMQAAALRMAEASLAEPGERTQAVNTLEKAFEGVAKPDDYRNKLIETKDALALLEQMCQTLRAGNDFANAGKIADLYAKICAPGKGRELPAEIADAWGRERLAEAKNASGAAAQHALDEARKQFRKAGAVYAEAATPDRPIPEQIDCLRRATNFFFKAQDKLDVENGLGLLERMTKLSPAGEADGEVVFLKALAHQQLGHKNEAIDSYKKIIQQADHPQAARARYELAHLLLENLPAKRDEQEPVYEQVTAELEKNLDPSMQEKDREVHESSMYLLGEATYQRRDWAKAQTRLEAALRFYPQNAHALQAEHMLARCSWFQAAQESHLLKDLQSRQGQLEQALKQQLPEKERESAKQELEKLKKDWEAVRVRKRELLEKAKKPFEEVENTLLKREQDGKLAESERILLRQASFAAAECYFFQEDFEEAVRRYQILRIRYEGQFEELVALSQLWQCHGVYLNEPTKATVWIEALRETLKKLPDTAFDGSSAYNKRDYWDGWIKQVSAPKTP